MKCRVFHTFTLCVCACLLAYLCNVISGRPSTVPTQATAKYSTLLQKWRKVRRRKSTTVSYNFNLLAISFHKICFYHVYVRAVFCKHVIQLKFVQTFSYWCS